MKKFDPQKLLSPHSLFLLYLILSSAAIMGFKMIFPGSIPLPFFSASWRLITGGETLIQLFPALALSALVIPFGVHFNPQEKYSSFSPKFLNDLGPFIFNAIFSAAIYALASLLILPLTLNYKTDLEAKARLFYLSEERARVHAGQGEWQEAAQFLDICNRIWPDAPELAGLRTETSIRLDEISHKQEPLPKGTLTTRYDLTTPKPVNAAQALALADAAMKEERYFDAHWLATLAGDLAGPGSSESAASAALASRAWNAVSSLEPNARQSEAYRIYYLKRDAYRALVSNEWIQAYYLFRDLLSAAPGDPDGQYFLSLSEQGLIRMAFFIDEIELRDSPDGALLSVPYNDGGSAGGRLVIRFKSLSMYPDVAYGIGAEILAFDYSGRQLWRIDAPYAKIVPLSIRQDLSIGQDLSNGQQNTGPRISILMHALDRMDANLSWKPTAVSFAGVAPVNTQISLDLNWDDFVLLSGISRGYDNLNPAQLIAAAGLGPDYGYLPQIFQAQAISRFTEPVLFLPLLILILAAAWRFRAPVRPRYMWLPMLGILPVVFNGVFMLYRYLTDNLTIWTVIGLGFSMVVFLFSAGVLVLFILSLIILAAQRG
ncbi:MAG: hypothetical protein FWD78_01930 [Treponema sp.]|nr:hypothetical protein [Treponema sp.]